MEQFCSLFAAAPQLNLLSPTLSGAPATGWGKPLQRPAA